MPVIEFRGATYRHASGAAVGPIDLAIEPGESLVLVGRSGAGKSTLLKLVNGLLITASGAVIVEGRSTREWDPTALRRRIGYVLQDVGLFPHLTVAQNVGVVPRLERWPAARVEARVSALLALVGLPPREYAARWPDELSGGQRQRVGVARALAADPSIVLMDEPFGALDAMTRDELRGELAALQRRLRKTIVLVTHDMAEAFALADRIGVIEAGVLIACDRPSAIASSADPRIVALVASVPSRPPAADEEPAR